MTQRCDTASQELDRRGRVRALDVCVCVLRSDDASCRGTRSSFVERACVRDKMHSADSIVSPRTPAPAPAPAPGPSEPLFNLTVR
jgi:hypothetical protein